MARRLDPALDAAQILQVVKEMEAAGDTQIAFSVRPFDLFSTIGVLQLALRHPNLSPEQLRIAETVTRHLVEGLRQVAPFTAALADEGFDPANDIDSSAPG